MLAVGISQEFVTGNQFFGGFIHYVHNILLYKLQKVQNKIAARKRRWFVSVLFVVV